MAKKITKSQSKAQGDLAIAKATAYSMKKNAKNAKQIQKTAEAQKTARAGIYATNVAAAAAENMRQRTEQAKAKYGAQAEIARWNSLMQGNPPSATENEGNTGSNPNNSAHSSTTEDRS